MKTGIVYKIYYNEIIYVGSTFSNLRTRWRSHKANFTRWLNEKGKKVASIFPYFKEYGIENFNIIELARVDVCDRKSLRIIEQNWLTTLNCVNTIKAYVSPKELHEQKQHRPKLKIECECGSICQRYDRHLITVKHKQFLKDGIKITIKRENSTQEKIYIECECGVQVLTSNIRHIKSKRHCQWLERQNNFSEKKRLIGRVYQIVHKERNSITYVGSTTSRLNVRWNGHLSGYRNYCRPNGNKKCIIYPYFDKYGVENFEIRLLCEYQIFDRKQLFTYEQLWIQKLQCINVRNAFILPLKEMKKDKAKTYYRANQPKIKKYYEENKEHIFIWKKVQITCVCGTITQQARIATHRKSLKHKQFEQDGIIIPYSRSRKESKRENDSSPTFPIDE